MVDSTRSRKQLWNYTSINGFLLLVTLVFVIISHVNSFEHDNDNSVDCSKLQMCMKCAEKMSCSWSLEKQTCVNATQSLEHLMVNIRAHCPQFSIVDSFVYKSNRLFTYKLKVSNDVSGFVKYLSNTNITCMLKEGLYNGTADVATDTIKCASVNIENLEMKDQKLMIFHFSVMFNDMTLRIDDGVNNYFTLYDGVYNNSYCHDNYTTKDCVSCFWDTEHYTFYYKRCSSSNKCTGLFEFYDQRNLNNDVNTSGERTSSIDNNTTTLNRFGPPANACPDMSIQLVDPLSAPWLSGTKMVITITNHQVLTESQIMTVSVAGRDCVHPKLLNNDTFECTAGTPKPNDLTSGAVQVMYGSTLLLTSAQTFRFIYPELTGMSPGCGPVSGGTLLRITGRSLNASSTVAVTVGPANVTCELVARYEDSILCVTGPSNGPVAGAVTVEFDKLLRRTVGPANTTATPSFEPMQFVYVSDPVVDAGQPFEGIASGGIYVPVRGRNFACVRDATLYVDDLDGMRHVADCWVVDDTSMMCRLPAIEVPRSSSEIVSLNFGFRVHFADHIMNLSPQPDYPSYLLYADPVFADFETNGRNVTIHGYHMDRGYRPSVDLVIRLRNSKGDLCVIIDTQRRSIVCVLPPLAAGTDNDLRELYVTVGNKFVRTLLKKKVCSYWNVVYVFLLIFSVLTGVLFVSLFGALVFLMWKTIVTSTDTCNSRSGFLL